MGKIARDISKAEKENFELIIVGGGIYGIMLALESSRRKIKTLLLEKDDFGGATTLNHLKTVHGGLRYLQSLDLERFNESVSERKWFIKHFPEYVNPMSCIMPLYGTGLKRNSIMRGALFMNDFFSMSRNKGVPEEKKLPGGSVLPPGKIMEIFNEVDGNGLKGGALWYDANVEEFQRLNMKLLKKVVDLGSTPLNYVEAKKLRTENKIVTGVECLNNENGEKIVFSANVVINATGPWSRKISEVFDRDCPVLLRKNLMLWNILFDREALSKSALGLTPKRGKGHTYFFHPWKGRLLIGTGEMVVGDIKNNLTVPANEIDKFIDDINSAVPGIGLKRKDIIKIYSGILPATKSGTLAKRPATVDHFKHGGPKGLFSISGVKFTTSRLVAEKTIKKIFPDSKPIDYMAVLKEDKNNPEFGIFKFDEVVDKNKIKELKEIVENESVIHLSDLIFRRTSLGENPKRVLESLESLKSLFQTKGEKWWEKEKSEVKKILKTEIG